MAGRVLQGLELFAQWGAVKGLEEGRGVAPPRWW